MKTMCGKRRSDHRGSRSELHRLPARRSADTTTLHSRAGNAAAVRVHGPPAAEALGSDCLVVWRMTVTAPNVGAHDLGSGRAGRAQRIVLFQAYDDFSSRVSFFQVPDRSRDLAQWVTPVDDRFHLSGLHEVAQNRQVLRVELRQKRGELLAHK